jgi:phosphoglycolate phosphatase
MKILNVLWDLDGTLTDPKLGIIQCIQFALRKFGREVPALDQLLWCIGPPLYESFPCLVPGSSHQDVLTLVDLYRERFADVGLFENELYPGIPELLGELGAHKKHFLATSKPHIFARRILTHFNLSQFFAGIHGSELNGDRCDKGELIEYVLKNEGLDRKQTVMIGDRKHDIIGAKKAGLIGVGITWGYGSPNELKDAGADFIFSNLPDLRDFLSERTEGL